MSSEKAAVFIYACIILTGCYRSPVVDIRAESEAINKIEDEWTASIKAKDTDKILGIFDAEAVEMNANAPICNGLQAIRKSLVSWFSDTTILHNTFKSDIDTIEVSASGDFAYARGNSQLNIRTSDGIIEEAAKWITIYRKVNGQWKAIVDIWNSDMPYLKGQSSSAYLFPYGNNKAAGKIVLLNGVRLYYEIYGKGEPLLLLHGNGGNIEGMRYQIEYFSKNYRVIAMDCRGRGKSELGKDSLTYMQITKDVASLLDFLHLDSAYIIGRSDGGIIALLMGIYFPEKVKKIAAFGANLSPDTTAAYSSIVEQIHKDRMHSEEMIAQNDATKDWLLIKQLNRLMEYQPHISADDLKKIESPVLILSCDRDVIKEEHTVFIYRNIPKANLCIFPGETHWITSENPVLFNSTVARFFSQPYKGNEIRN